MSSRRLHERYVFLQFENKKDVLDYMDGFRKEASSGTNCLPYRVSLTVQLVC